MASEFVRNCALGTIALISVLKLSAELGADRAWWLELPVHFQPQYAITLALSLAALTGTCAVAGDFTPGEGVAVAVALLVGGHAAAAALALTPAQRALAP